MTPAENQDKFGTTYTVCIRDIDAGPSSGPRRRLFQEPTKNRSTKVSEPKKGILGIRAEAELAGQRPLLAQALGATLSGVTPMPVFH